MSDTDTATSELERRYNDARDALLLEFGHRWTIRKPWLMTGHRLFVVSVFLAGGADRLRLVTLLAVFAVQYAVEITDAFYVRRNGCSVNGVAMSTALSMAVLSTGAALTGGLASPLLPCLIAPVIIPAAGFGRRPPTYLLLGELVAVLMIILVLPPWVTGPELAYPWISIGITGGIIFAVWVSVTNLVMLSELYARAAMMTARMREQVLEQHDARARSLETIGARVAHELKNPLAAIAGLVQLLLQSDHDPKTRERLGVVGSEVGRMEKVIREYLAFSRPLEDVHPVDVDLGSLADDVIAVLEARARSRGALLERSGDSIRANVDPARIKEALLNLVDNAIEASPAGARVTVELGRVPGSTTVWVRDHGEGIGPENLARLGTPYFTTRPDGTGLGVVMARAAIEQHGGKLAFHSRPGEGTVAEISIPDRPRCSAQVAA